MNNSKNEIGFFKSLKDKIKSNIKLIAIFSVLLILMIISYQFFIFYQKNKLLELSLKYNESFNSNSQDEFLENMISISNYDNFYGLMAKLEIINFKIRKENYNEAFNDYINLLKNNKLNPNYKSLIAINASYNLINKIESEQINNLLSFVDDSLDSFIGYKLEISYLISLNQNNINESNILYNNIINNEKISQTIKERIKKINDFEKYK